MLQLSQESGIMCQAFLLGLLIFKFPPCPSDFLRKEEDSESLVPSCVDSPHCLWSLPYLGPLSSDVCANWPTERPEINRVCERNRERTPLMKASFQSIPSVGWGSGAFSGGFARLPLGLDFHECHTGSLWESR